MSKPATIYLLNGERVEALRYEYSEFGVIATVPSNSDHEYTIEYFIPYQRVQYLVLK